MARRTRQKYRDPGRPANGYREPSESEVASSLAHLVGETRTCVVSDHHKLSDNARDDLGVIYLRRAADQLEEEVALRRKYGR